MSIVKCGLGWDYRDNTNGGTKSSGTEHGEIIFSYFRIEHLIQQGGQKITLQYFSYKVKIIITIPQQDLITVESYRKIMKISRNK